LTVQGWPAAGSGETIWPMSQDDPEKRIAELEHRLAEERAVVHPAASQAPNTSPGWLTSEQVLSVAFAKPAGGKRGYNEDEVDAFLDLVESALRDPAGSALTAEDVHMVAFSKPPIGKRGYHEDEVDAFLDLVEENLRSRQGGGPPPSQVGLPRPLAGRSSAMQPRSESWFRKVFRRGG
jgi:DivIVA domain-containing protein